MATLVFTELGGTIPGGAAEVLRTLPRRDRGLLRLAHARGASHAELADALGVSRATVRKWIGRAEAHARDPRRLALATHLTRLRERDRRLAYLHWVVGLSIREIARQRLVPAFGRAGRHPSEATLRRHLRRIGRRLDDLQAEGDADAALTPHTAR